MGNEENRTTELALGEMQLIRPTSEFKVGHLPFQGKVKGILPRWGRSKSSATTRADSNFAVLSPDFLSFFSFPRKKRYPCGRRFFRSYWIGR